MTHTFAIMRVSKSTYDEVAAKLREAGYDQAFIDEGRGHGLCLDMHGIALERDPLEEVEVDLSGLIGGGVTAEVIALGQVLSRDRATRRLTSALGVSEVCEYHADIAMNRAEEMDRPLRVEKILSPKNDCGFCKTDKIFKERGL